MLVLSRRPQQSLLIGHDVVITVLEVNGDTVRIGISAPPEVQIHREEVYRDLQRSNREAAGSPSGVADFSRQLKPRRPDHAVDKAAGDTGGDADGDMVGDMGGDAGGGPAGDSVRPKAAPVQRAAGAEATSVGADEASDGAEASGGWDQPHEPVSLLG